MYSPMCFYMFIWNSLGPICYASSSFFFYWLNDKTLLYFFFFTRYLLIINEVDLFLRRISINSIFFVVHSSALDLKKKKVIYFFKSILYHFSLFLKPACINKVYVNKLFYLVYLNGYIWSLCTHVQYREYPYLYLLLRKANLIYFKPKIYLFLHIKAVPLWWTYIYVQNRIFRAIYNTLNICEFHKVLVMELLYLHNTSVCVCVLRTTTKNLYNKMSQILLLHTHTHTTYILK